MFFTYLTQIMRETVLLSIRKIQKSKTIFSPDSRKRSLALHYNSKSILEYTYRYQKPSLPHQKTQVFINYRFLAFFSRLMVILSDAYLSSSYCDTSLYKWIWDSDCNKIFSTVLLSNLRTKCTEREENKSRLHWYFPDCHK